MQGFRKLNSLLRAEASDSVPPAQLTDVYAYARCIAEIEGVVAVVSDLQASTSKIFCGAFGQRLSLQDYREENSIWEKKILDLMPEVEREEKFLAELRFHHRMMQPPLRRRNCYLLTRLRMKSASGELIDVIHRMYYIFDPQSNRLRYAICLYGPDILPFSGRSIIVDSSTGTTEALTSDADGQILSPRLRQILSLIDSGLTSKAIAQRLNISRHTVNRHRQEIITRLQVRNSVEACRLAKSLNII